MSEVLSMLTECTCLCRDALFALWATLATFSSAQSTPREYLAFQIFTASHDSQTLQSSFPPMAGNIADQIDAILRATGTPGTQSRKLGFIVGPLAFDDKDEQVRQLMRGAFAIALQRNVAAGFHVDDSMFWDRLTALNKPENIEWLDWDKTPNTGRRLDWSSTPTKIMPQLCFNSPAVQAAVVTRAKLIGQEVLRGMEMLRDHHHPELFIGVIAGWETQIGRDFATGKTSGYHALANKGYSAKNPPKEVDEARADVVKDFINLWTASLARAGVPDDKIYSHTACMSKASFDIGSFSQPGQFQDSYLQTVNFTPPSASFGAHHRPGFSTYPQFGILEQIEGERTKKGNPGWASAEGTAVDPGAAEKGDAGMSMEHYLGNLFNRGAVLVNVFGCGIGSADNPFRKVAESKTAIAAYQKFLRGEPLQSDPSAQVPSPQFFNKLRRLQRELPPYLAKHGSEKVGPLYEKLGRELGAQHYQDAERSVDQIFSAMRG